MYFVQNKNILQKKHWKALPRYVYEVDFTFYKTKRIL